MRPGLFLWLTFIICFQGQAQNLTISAKAVDKETKEPLPFASVGIKGKPIGTITNLGGEFDFHFPIEYRNETFVISMLGYQNYETPVQTLLDSKDQEIVLVKSTTILNTVVISDTLLGGDILRIALMRIGENYPDRPFLLDAFYRDVKKVGGKYISFPAAGTAHWRVGLRNPAELRSAPCCG